jgi:formylglycine-generating enzyme
MSGGTFTLGDDSALAYPEDGEGSIAADVKPFELGTTAVANEEFARFVDATGYLTDAERFGWSFVFGLLLPRSFPETRGVVGAEWWRQVYGATWQFPEGEGSSITTRTDHPVVHVSFNDALAYAEWTGTRLPSEIEWEYAARASSSTIWVWGDDREPGGVHHMNVFQGDFPNHDSGADGWKSTCPVRSFQPNSLGLWNMIGNVWEWTSDAFVPKSRFVTANPQQPVLLKGGSFLCHESYCRRYRAAARMGNGADSSASNIGFRIAREASLGN